jgi:hypothetical protein
MEADALMSQHQFPIDQEALDARIQAMVEARVQAMMMSGAAQLPAATSDETLVDAKQVRGPILGGRSDMWLHRKLKDPNPETKFPDPDVVLSGRRYWRRGTVRAWIDAQARKGARTRGPAASTAAMLLLLLAPPDLQIWVPWAPAVTLARDPNTLASTETAAAPVFTACRATAPRAADHEIAPAIGATDLRDTETVEGARAGSAAPTPMSAAITSAAPEVA